MHTERLAMTHRVHHPFNDVQLMTAHEPSRVVDLIDVARVTRSIEVNRGFDVLFDTDRPALHFGAVYE